MTATASPPDPRQVAYWVTMFLPDRWTPPPADAKPNELYIYRPDFYQDQDGIERRVALWLNPNLRSTEAIHLQDVFSHHPTGKTASPAAAAAGARRGCRRRVGRRCARQPVR